MCEIRVGVPDELVKPTGNGIKEIGKSIRRLVGEGLGLIVS